MNFHLVLKRELLWERFLQTLIQVCSALCYMFSIVDVVSQRGLDMLTA